MFLFWLLNIKNIYVDIFVVIKNICRYICSYKKYICRYRNNSLECRICMLIYYVDMFNKNMEVVVFYFLVNI